ncbi:AtpZ/AtpI family protein [Ferruginibacter albus]|uniref:AtpZ/AtpI family protein n=1 Tax=Ferruginibacter albus TaxID=2875540 RepID=UPI001CC8250F|nr:AtpZ/AtpI family protein [Ferruginibacter albus]UAY51492.1 hypothetical protein K9M53_12960 [Ferruginibacter albus]
MPSTNKDNNRILLRYAGLATQLIVLMAITVWAGIRLDERFHVKRPLLVWLLPLLAIISLIVKIIKDTSKKK